MADACYGCRAGKWITSVSSRYVRACPRTDNRIPQSTSGPAVIRRLLLLVAVNNASSAFVRAGSGSTQPNTHAGHRRRRAGIWDTGGLLLPAICCAGLLTVLPHRYNALLRLVPHAIGGFNETREVFLLPVNEVAAQVHYFAVIAAVFCER